MEKLFFQSSKHNIILDTLNVSQVVDVRSKCKLENMLLHYYYFSILTSLFDKNIMLSLVNRSIPKKWKIENILTNTVILTCVDFISIWKRMVCRRNDFYLYWKKYQIDILIVFFWWF